MLNSQEMQGYVWDYSAAPGDSAPQDPETLEEELDELMKTDPTEESTVTSSTENSENNS